MHLPAYTCTCAHTHAAATTLALLKSGVISQLLQGTLEK